MFETTQTANLYQYDNCQEKKGGLVHLNHTDVDLERFGKIEHDLPLPSIANEKRSHDVENTCSLLH